MIMLFMNGTASSHGEKGQACETFSASMTSMEWIGFPFESILAVDSDKKMIKGEPTHRWHLSLETLPSWGKVEKI